MLAVNLTLQRNIYLQSDPPLQQKRLRRINALAVKASKKVQLSRTGSRLRAIQRAIDKVRTLPLSLPKGGSESNFVIFL